MINYEPALAVLQMTKTRVLPGLVEQELNLVMLGGRKGYKLNLVMLGGRKVTNLTS